MCKLGNKENEYEDAIAYDLDRMRFAIADGASGSAYAELWASALTDTYVNLEESLFEDPVGAFSKTQGGARKKWYTGINWNSMPWFLKNKSVVGSYSTLLLLEMRKVNKGLDFICSAIGDSCLFVIDQRLRVSFPITDHKEFGVNPKLVWSGQGFPAKVDVKLKLPVVQTIRGTVSRGDRMILATDSVSKWLLQNESDDPWDILLDNPRELRESISDLINKGSMRNDDITAAVLSFTAN
jgi:serine/threonine protein phosphatase PrpC